MVIGLCCSLLLGIIIYGVASSGMSYRDYEHQSQMDKRRELELEKLQLEVERLRRRDYDAPV